MATSLVALALCLAAPLAATAGDDAVPGGDWPAFLGPTGDGKSPEKGLWLDWPEKGPPVLWQRDLGSGYGPPIVCRGRLFVFDRVRDRARLACLEAASGKEIWIFEYATAYEDLYGYNNGPRASPVTDGERVYIFGAEGMLHAVRFDDGKLVWSVDTQARYHVVQNFFGVGSAPVVEGDLLIAQVGGSPPGSAAISSGEVRGAGSGIVAFDRKTGKEVYKITDELASYASPTLATIDGRRFCFVFARGGLVAFEPSTGKIDFQYPWRARILESVNASNPVVAGDRVLISETYGPGSSLLRVKRGGHEVIWDDARRRDKALQTHWNTPIHHEGHVYGSSGRHTPEAELRCIELATGAVRWSQPRLGRASLLFVDGRFIGLTEHGVLFVFRADPAKLDMTVTCRLADASGAELLRYPAWAAPILAGGLLYARDERRIVCLDIRKAP